MSRSDSHDVAWIGSPRSGDGRIEGNRGQGHSDLAVILRDELAALERLTEHADRLANTGPMRSAIDAWSGVALLAERLLGRSDTSVIDAMRIIAAMMLRIDRGDDAIRVLGDAAERLAETGARSSDRGIAIDAEMGAIRRSRSTPAPAETPDPPARGGWSASRSS